MVTDEQYKALQDRVTTLERKLSLLSKQISSMMLKTDSIPYSVIEKKATRKKDVTKYMFEGQLYCKRRLAYALVTKYISDNSISCFEEVQKVFPDYLQGSLGVIRSATAAEQYSNANRRFFFSDEDVIYFENQPYVICAQWEKKNINRLLSVANKLGYSISPIIVQ